ncbi:hypothetical protein DXV76_17050 [Rhodobacteraceae bacterium CCMM004]|nr:hypothetical protein DXV76_17050 [Rhodobacteraceae bacterium CCMM004]
MSVSGRWGLSVTQAAALALPMAVAIALRGPGAAVVLAMCLAAAVGAEVVFTALRSRPPSVHGMVTALIVALFLAPDTPLWQVALAVVLGVVLGELVFGGRGFSFVSPGATALAIFAFSFPQAALAAPEVAVAAAALPGAAWLIWRRWLPWEAALAAAIAFAVLSAGTVPPAWPALALAAAFLLADPFAAAETPVGRWVYGALAGGLAVWFGGGVAAAVFAALLSQVFAPLIDAGVNAAWAARRRRRAHV